MVKPLNLYVFVISRYTNLNFGISGEFVRNGNHNTASGSNVAKQLLGMRRQTTILEQSLKQHTRTLIQFLSHARKMCHFYENYPMTDDKKIYKVAQSVVQ